MPLNTREGVAEAPIEPGRAHVVRAVAFGTGVEVVALDRALEALALGRAGDLDHLADLEGLDGHVSPTVQLAGLVAELLDGAQRRRAGLLEVAELALDSAFSRTEPKPSWTAS
jgi:hypothetical protein